MGHAAVEVMRVKLFPADRNLKPESEIARLAHLQADEVALEPGADDAGWSLEPKILQRAGDPVGEPGKTARTVPAHLGFAAVGVVIAHPEIGAIRRPLENEHAIRADSAMAIANPGNLLGGEHEIAGPIVEENEIVPRAGHLGEAEHATCWLAQASMKAKPASSDPCRSPLFPYTSRVLFRLWPFLLFAALLPNESRAAVPPSPLNQVILEQIKKMPVGGRYATTHAATIRLRSAAHFESGKFFILPDAASPSFCSGATYLVFVKTIEALRARGDLHLSYNALDALMIRDQRDGEGIWGRWNANGPGTARLFHELDLGRNFDDFAEAEPGDFMKIFWSPEVGRSERGHSVIYLGTENREGVEYVRFWSSNLPNGYGERSVPRSKIAHAIFSRLYTPANLERIESSPMVDTYLASLLRIRSSYSEACRKCGI